MSKEEEPKKRRLRDESRMREKFENGFAVGGDRSRDPASSRVNGVEWRGIMWGLVLSCHWMHQKDGG